MRGKRVWYTVLLTIIGLLGGTGVSLWIGWVVAPVEYTDTDLSYLRSDYRDDFLLLVSEAYALDGDLDTARARVALLALPDPANAVADLAERAIARHAPPSHIRALVGLATAMGGQRDTFHPYLPLSDDAP